MIAEKQLARQDTDFAINPGNNNETSIKITDEIRDLFLDLVPSEDKVKKEANFFIYKEDFLKSACNIISSLPLLDKHGHPICFSINFCDEFISKINNYFGEENVKEYKAELLYNQSRSSCLQGFSKDFNIRSYMVEIWSTIRFYKKNDGVHMRLLFSKGNKADSNEEDCQNMAYQEIYYGAPGTGKSYTIKARTKFFPKDAVFRTTFHPDSDYSSFVGAYKPTTIDVPKQFTFGDKLRTFTDSEGNPVTEQKIVYGFIKQAFLKAYMKAWADVENKVALIIEEINRGNCAQIFGDLFQLLDRSKGFSDYPIEADEDLRKNLKVEFAKIKKPSTDYIKNLNDKYSDNYSNIFEKIWNGELLLLPNNLYIWATMNTSDQSLFPIDSAFKRRWDWKYVKIKNGKDKLGNQLNWKIVIKDEADNVVKVGENEEISWWTFIENINAIIASMTSSADKQLGYFFCKPTEKAEETDEEPSIITADTLVGKVIFYLWNDVFKDYGFEDAYLFSYIEKVEGKDVEKDLTFADFYDEEGEHVNTTRLADFLGKVLTWQKNNEGKE